MRRSRALLWSASCIVAAFSVMPVARAGGDPFEYLPPGDLAAGSGTGLETYEVYAPGMRFPIEEGPAFPNSQVWGAGGSQGGGGSQCDAVNYTYPWRDNYCETRSWDMPLCPAGQGHQGQDIRPATCDKATYWTVASEAGTITNIGSYSVYLTDADGTRFDYLHGEQNAVGYGQEMSKAERINLVSNAFGGTATTIHLHFNIQQDIAGHGFVYVPPYMSLVQSYEELMGIGNEPPQGAAQVGCDAITGWAQDPDDPEAPVELELWFDGEAGAPSAIGVAIVADEHDAALCEQLGSCEHGFTAELPRCLKDGTPHEVRVYGRDDQGTLVEVEASPAEVACDAPQVPDGVRRHIVSPESLAAWGISTVWDKAPLTAAEVAEIPAGEVLPNAPLLVRSDDGDPALWLIDTGVRRRVDAATQTTWGWTAEDVLEWPAESVAGVPEGTPWRSERFVIQADGEPALHLMDDPLMDDCGMGDATDPDCDEGDEGGTSVSYGDGDDAGCACSASTRSTGAWLGMFGLLVFARRRRRRETRPA